MGRVIPLPMRSRLSDTASPKEATMLTVQTLLPHFQAFVAADAARMSARPAGMPRSAWRQQNRIEGGAFSVRDTAYKTQPVRTLGIDVAGNPYDVWVWSTGARPRVIEHIDLRASDADQRLARYVAQ